MLRGELRRSALDSRCRAVQINLEYYSTEWMVCELLRRDWRLVEHNGETLGPTCPACVQQHKEELQEAPHVQDETH
ncbi:hypothetical protein [Marinomonas mediterranea]|uniref:hypothetical protein n=1 Tax=Marinomonas mediterranea TaxID=119864 RepID=UPI0011D26FD1|nr:hypothetical protein [Marinomonas mediterranea]WCN18919.1 hypothetical protein GV053_18670 [Marinomonas mediterranea MMB-1]